MEEKIFEDFERHLLNDEKPSEYIRKTLYKLKGTDLEVLLKLEKIEQEKRHHPEGNVLNHTLLVVDAAASVRKYAHNSRALMWAALFHDLGKITTTKVRNGRITSYEHDTVGSKEALKMFKKYDLAEAKFEETVANMVKYHMHHLYISRDLPFGNERQMIVDVDLNDMALLFYSDKLGRGPLTKESKERVGKEVIAILKKLDKKYHLHINDTLRRFSEIIE